MKVTIHSILGLREVLGNERVDMNIPEGSTVAELIYLMINTWKDKILPYLLEKEKGRIHPYIRIMINGKQIRTSEITEIKLNEGDEILIIPFAAGG